MLIDIVQITETDGKAIGKFTCRMTTQHAQDTSQLMHTTLHNCLAPNQTIQVMPKYNGIIIEVIFLCNQTIQVIPERQKKTINGKKKL